jgi:hypothetical protein
MLMLMLMPCHAMLCHPPFHPSPSYLRERLANRLLILVPILLFFLSFLVLPSPSLSVSLPCQSVSLSSSPLCRTLPFSPSHPLALFPTHHSPTHSLSQVSTNPSLSSLGKVQSSHRPRGFDAETGLPRPIHPGAGVPSSPGISLPERTLVAWWGAHGQTALGRTNERRRLWGEGPDGSGQ